MRRESYVEGTPRSREMYERAKRIYPGGISYRVRYFEPYPFCAANASGSRLYDIDGNSYTDYWCGHFALILGHRHPAVIKAVEEQLDRGYNYGVFHDVEIRLAEQVAKMVPSAKMVRFACSGTEANMYALRLARTYTKRVKIAKFEGNWHGGYDPLHVAVKPPLDQPQSGGLAEGAIKDTIVLPFNDLEGVRKRIEGLDLACIVIEPVMGGGGIVPAEKEFLKGLREICDDAGALLVFDEVMTGFRLSPGGAQQLYGVLPDLTVLGKIVGGGFPIGAIAGRGEIMEHMDHFKYQGNEYCFLGGTHVGNPISTSAGYATLKLLEDGTIHSRIDKLREKASRGMQDIFDRSDFEAQTLGIGSLFGCHFTRHKPIKDIHAVSLGNVEAAKRFHRYLLDRGIFILTPILIHGAISSAHTEEDIDELLAAAEGFVKSEAKE